MGWMSTQKESYESPLSARYADAEMKFIFSPDKKFRTWRKLWIALAQAEKELGLDITQEQIDEMAAFQNEINYEVAEAREKVVRHDVMSHVYAFGEQCPKARPIIHLGATSCYVGDNTDIIVMHDALRLVRTKLVQVIRALSAFALKYKDLPTLAFTHFQPAQPDQQSANGQRCGCKTYSWIWRMWSTSSPKLSCWVLRGRPALKPAF